MNYKLINFCEFDKYAEQAYCAIHNVDPKLNLGDITKVNEKEIADFNMIVGGSPCFVAGTKVLTDMGYINIEDLKVGDMVLTHTNSFKPILRIGNNKNQEVYQIKTQGMLPIKATKNHPFYVRTKTRKWNSNKKCWNIVFSEPNKMCLENLKQNDYLGVHILNSNQNKLNLNELECWLLGRYVADGHFVDYKRKDKLNSYNREIVFSIGDKKIIDFEEKTKEMPHKTYLHAKGCYRCVFKDKRIWDIINNYNFGKFAINKNIPNEILDLPKDLLSHFLDGYFSGNGCVVKKHIQATTTSENLAMSLCLAVQKVYRVGCGIYFDERPSTCIIEGRIVNQQNTYMIRFNPKTTKQKKYYVIDDIIWYPIRKIKKEENVSNVYNIEVENDHTYTANNAITFNCQDFSVAGKQKGVGWTCKDCFDENREPYSYNPLTVHYTKRDRCPNCSSTNIEKTRSSLLVEWLRILKEKMPNFGIYENVKNIVGKRFKETFDLFENELKEYGYNTYWKVLNAKDYGIPQNRERIYLILVKKELDNGKFRFPKPFDNGLRLKDILENEVDESFYMSQDRVDKLLNSSFIQEKLRIQSTDICGCLLARDYKDPKCVPIDKSYNNPKPIDVANCITSREDRGISNRLKEGTAILENKVVQVGNYIDDGRWDNPQVGRVYDTDGCSPTLNTMQGGDRQPKILQKSREFNEVCIAAVRGRNTNNPSDRTIGSPTEQRLEANTRGTSNTITTVAKDNYVLEPQILRPERTEYGKQIRKAYEAGKIQESRHNMTTLQPRQDGVSNTLTTVQKDNLLVEPQVLCPQRQYDENGVRSVNHSISDISPTILATQYKSGDNQPKIMEPVGVILNNNIIDLFVAFTMLCDVNNIQKEGDIHKERTDKILSILWETITQKATQWKTGRYECVPKEKILQSSLHEERVCNNQERKSIMGEFSCIGEMYKRFNIKEIRMRKMWEDWKIRYSSYRFRLSEQSIKQFDDFVQELSYENTQDQKFLLVLQKSNEGIEFLQQTLLNIQEIWMSITQTEQQKLQKLWEEYDSTKLMYQRLSRKDDETKQIRIRKLTPIETWRLMGFSDEDFCKAQKGINDAFHKGKNRANSQLYKIAGNSIVTNVLFHIYIELYKAMPYLFEDMKLSSFFSGCGAFEKALDNFFNYIQESRKDEDTGNFNQPPTPQTTSSSLTV